MYGTREGWLTPPADAGLLLDKYLDSRASDGCYHKNRTESSFSSVQQNRLKFVAKAGNEISDQDEGDEERR